jgi:hypothetical protein
MGKSDSAGLEELGGCIVRVSMRFATRPNERVKYVTRNAPISRTLKMLYPSLVFTAPAEAPTSITRAKKLIFTGQRLF